MMMRGISGLVILFFGLAAVTLCFGAALHSHGLQADRVVVEKKARQMALLSKGQVLKTYRVALGLEPEGAKVQQGDNRTPEGIYVIDFRNNKSRFHLSLHVSYPNSLDVARAKRLGVSPGGDIMIHGIGKKFGWIGKSHAESDWTNGCIAVTNDEIEEIWGLVPNGAVVEIMP